MVTEGLVMRNSVLTYHRGNSEAEIGRTKAITWQVMWFTEVITPWLSGGCMLVYEFSNKFCRLI